MNKNIKCGYSFSKLDRREHFGTTFIVFFYNFSFFVPLAPPVPVVEDRNVMQRHRLYMTSFVTSKVQTTVNVVSFFRKTG